MRNLLLAGVVAITGMALVAPASAEFRVRYADWRRAGGLGSRSLPRLRSPWLPRIRV